MAVSAGSVRVEHLSCICCFIMLLNDGAAAGDFLPQLEKRTVLFIFQTRQISQSLQLIAALEINRISQPFQLIAVLDLSLIHI